MKDYDFSDFNQFLNYFSAWFDQNEMLWDLGIKEDLIKNSKSLREQIRQLDKYFDKVLIAEQFDESLILMKEFLCWDTQDILYFKVKLHLKCINLYS